MRIIRRLQTLSLPHLPQASVNLAIAAHPYRTRPNKKVIQQQQAMSNKH